MEDSTEPLSPLSGWVTSRFTGPPWPNEMTFVELLLPQSDKGVPRTQPRESSDFEEHVRQRKGIH